MSRAKHLIQMGAQATQGQNRYVLAVDRMELNSKDRPKVDGLPVPAVERSNGVCQIGREFSRPPGLLRHVLGYGPKRPTLRSRVRVRPNADYVAKGSPVAAVDANGSLSARRGLKVRACLAQTPRLDRYCSVACASAESRLGSFWCYA
jgi:hypothetical protein